MTYQILHGNNLDILPTLADNSIDSIVTDPPYELGFMGKKWDSSGIAYSVELWQQCLRVLKPGGHLLSFGGTRTYHRVAVAIEDAGFELRDSIAWLYGSGFPKSLDISKAIDKGQGQNRDRQLAFTAWMRKSGLSQSDCGKLLQPFAKNLESARAMAQHYYSDKQQPAIATADIFDWLRPYLPEVPEEIERLVAERTGIEWTEYKNRKVISEKPAYGIGSTGNTFGGHSEGAVAKETLPSTPEAKQWQGWGTALKPAFEPVIVARKPIEGTVANNVLKWGTGGLNIDGSRIGFESNADKAKVQNAKWHSVPNQTYGTYSKQANSEVLLGADSTPDKGRWPANIILDPYTAELLDEQSGTLKSGKLNTAQTKTSIFGGKTNERFGTYEQSEGGASRFFYVAKASKRDRNEGLEELEETTAADMVDREPDSAGMNSPRAGAGRTSGAKNFHPTVKPTTLMEYLIKLVTPPNGTVLDPFTGSGSTGKAAILQGFDFIGIEMTEEYLPIIQGRLKHAEAIVAERIKETSDKQSEVLF
jgi:DNA modification methylase